MSPIALVVVAHSDRLAHGAAELAAQMAPTVTIIPAGGAAGGGIGTDFDAVQSAYAAALAVGDGVVVLCDLGSAIMTAETARDFVPETEQGRIEIADAPIVEGLVAAAVAAETGADLVAVRAAAEGARSAREQASVLSGAAAAAPQPSADTRYLRRAVLVNRDGLHARPAAEFVKLAATFDTRVTVNGKDARSLLAIMSLGLVRGTEIEIAAADDTGKAAVDALAALVADGFGEAEPHGKDPA